MPNVSWIKMSSAPALYFVFSRVEADYLCWPDPAETFDPAANRGRWHMDFRWQNLRLLAFGIVLLLALAQPRTATAIPVTNYRFDLTVDLIEFFTPEELARICGADPLLTAITSVPFCKPHGNSAAPVAIGDQFLGRFQIQTDLAGLADGLYDIPVKSLFIVIGMMRWDDSTVGGTGNSCFSQEWRVTDCLAGYYGITSAFSEGVGFRVEGGQITSLLTGFYSGGDLPNVTFGRDWVGGPDRWYTHGSGAIGGTFRVWEVPEPSALVLLVMGLAGLTLARQRRDGRAHNH